MQAIPNSGERSQDSKLIAQYLFLLLIASGIVSSAALLWSWRGAVGLDGYGELLKEIANIGTLVCGVLGLTLVGDRAIIENGFWAWIRNKLTQKTSLLWGCNIIMLVALAFGVVAWWQTRSITIYSDQPVVLLNIDNIKAPIIIGYLPSGDERTVLLHKSRTMIGFRIAGSDKVGKQAVPEHSSALGDFIFLRTKEVEHDAEMLAPNGQ